jgi:hypothetical protein
MGPDDDTPRPPDPPHPFPPLPTDVLVNIAGLRPDQVDAGHWATLTGLACEVLHLRLAVNELQLENVRLKRRMLAMGQAMEPKPN